MRQLEERLVRHNAHDKTEAAVASDLRIAYPLPKLEAKLVSNLLLLTIYNAGAPYHPSDQGDIKSMLASVEQLEHLVCRLKCDILHLSNTYSHETMDLWR